MEFFDSIFDRALSKYQNNDISIRLKARFLLIMCFTILGLMPVMMGYTIYLHLHNPEFGYSINFSILIPQITGYCFVIIITFALTKGYFRAAAHSLMIILFTTIWVVMSIPHPYVIATLDTIVIAVALMSMIPLAASRHGRSPFFYGAMNIIALYSFMFYYRSEMNLLPIVLIDYLADNTMAFIFVSILSWNIIKINNTSLDMAARFNNELKQNNYELEAVNEELLAAVEELEASNERIEEQHRELMESQNQLLQAQKMEAIGTLAAGFAHDFNNILAGITGSLDIIQYRLNSDEQLDMDELKGFVDTALKSSGRARDITRQLMTLSRKSEPQTSIIDITSALKNIYTICRNSFPKSVSLDFSIPDHNIYMYGDTSQLEQIFLNICLNGSHAMTIMRPDDSHQGGTLTLFTEKIVSDNSFIIKHPEASADTVYMRISIKDTGVGIDEDVMKHIFEPFYTTKKDNAGTGLGLSMVYGILKQHRGFIDIYSQPGRGSIFSIFLPLIENSVPPVSDNNKNIIVTGEGLILLVDDEEAVLKISKRILDLCGYNVMTAANGFEALDLYKENCSKITAVVIDFSMPAMSGLEVYEKMKLINPAVKALLISGFMESQVMSMAKEKGITHFLSKPFSAAELSVKLKNLICLEGAAKPPSKYTD